MHPTFLLPNSSFLILSPSRRKLYFAERCSIHLSLELSTMSDVFLSYAKADRPHAMELAEELRTHGYSVWIDQGSIGGAQNWSVEIVEAINACSTLLVLISPSSAASHNVAKEVQLASEKRKNLLPVVLERIQLPAMLEYPLAGLQRVYFQDRPSVLGALERLYGRGDSSATPAPASSLQISDGTLRIAVLPFDDLSPQHDNQWFADGMMDELIGTLGHLDRVKVPGRSDVLHYREHHMSSRDIARELGVRYLIEGGVRKAGEHIRINAALIDTHNHERLWSNQFDGSFDDVFAFQESVARHITEALKLKLTPKEEEAIETRPTQNVEAYELYLKGRHEQYYLTKESYERALALYEQAATLDPSYMQAQIGIASVCCAYYREYSRSPKWLEHAGASLAKAEAIGGETSKSLYIRGMIEWLRGDNETAIETLTRSAELDPKSHNAFNVLGAIYLANGQWPEAIEAFQRVVDVAESTQSYFNLLSTLGTDLHRERLKKTAQKALPLFDRHLKIEPEDRSAAVSRAFVLLWAGNEAEARSVADRLSSMDDLGGYALYNLGCLYDNLGKPDLYIAMLRKAISRGYREIERTRNYLFSTKAAIYEEELQGIIVELEELSEKERTTSPE